MWALLKRLTGPSYRAMMAEADRARDVGDFRGAAALYGRMARRFDDDSGLLVLGGNMLKDSGQFAEARRSYDLALAQRPEDADLHLQLGHLAKLQGLWTEAADWYARSVTLDPGRQDAADELKHALARRPAVFEGDGVGASVLTSADMTGLLSHRLRVACRVRPA